MSNRGKGEKIKQLYNSGYSYNQIQKELNCSPATICYHLNSKYKLKQIKKSKNVRKLAHPYCAKVKSFKETRNKVKKNKNPTMADKHLINKKLTMFFSILQEGKLIMSNKSNFTFQEVIDKFGENPKCALTGREIDIYKPRTYQFDHKIPRSRGGDNTLDNLQILTKEANMAKNDMTNDEFMNMCKQILEINGYKVDKI